VVIPLVNALRPSDATGTVLILESAITDVLSIVFTFGVLQAAGQGDVQVGRVIGQTLASLVFAALIGVAGGVGWLRVWNTVRELPATTFSTIAAALVLYGIAEGLGFSGAIATLAFGLTLTNHQPMGLGRFLRDQHGSTVTPEEQRFYREVVFLLKTFFFVYLGLSMRLDDIRDFGVAAAMVAIVYAVRAVIAVRTMPRATSRREVALVGAMAPKGLAAAVLAGLPLQAGVPEGATIQAVTYAVVLVSITVTALAVPVIQQVFPADHATAATGTPDEPTRSIPSAS
jgi:NhaP-type Na+/H+ or K+/H+ antiporter